MYKTPIIILCLFIQSLFSQPVEQVVILGSGPAGLTAAIYTSRADLSTLVIEGPEPNGQIGLSYMVENYPGFPEGINGYELGEKMREQALRFGTRIQTGQVTAVDLKKYPFVLTTDKGNILTNSLIIASGASAKWLGLPSEKAFIGNGVSSCAVCDGAAYRDKKVIVVGGGDAALEDALFLTRYASDVTVIHRKDTLRASKYLQKKAFENAKIRFIWDSVVEDILDPQMNKITSIKIKNVKTGQSEMIPAEGVFIAIGHQPNSEIFKGQLILDEEGYIKTKPFTTKTSVAGVFASGDVADPHYRQAITSAGTGCMSAIDANHYLQNKE